MVITDLTEENFVQFAIEHYDNPCCETVEEFENDLKLLRNIRRLMIRYRKGGELKEKLIMNHIICFMNVFPNLPAVRMMMLKLDEDHYPILKPFLVSMWRCPEKVPLVNGKTYYMSDISMDKNVIQALRNLRNT